MHLCVNMAKQRLTKVMRQPLDWVSLKRRRRFMNACVGCCAFASLLLW
jgi:hypothetical protein